MTFYDWCFVVISTILFMHYIFLFVDDDSKYQKRRFRKALDRIYKYIVINNEAYEDGLKFTELKVIYKNREFNIGIHKKEHNHHYTTYHIFINGDDAAMFHRLGDCCKSYYYFEELNKRSKFEVQEIIYAGAKEAKKLTKATAEKTDSWNEYSYFK